MLSLIRLLLPAIPLALIALPAQAYVGPGLGAGTIAVVLGVLGAVVMAFFALLWYPLKRMWNKGKSNGSGRQNGDSETDIDLDYDDDDGGDSDSGGDGD
ncbi:MAG: hypothetical protein ACPGO3_11390 [Magnetospiraceae bacterium]